MEFSIVAPDVEELVVGEPEAVAAENARRKVQAVLEAAGDAALPAGDAVLGVDTVVSIGERMYDKPAAADQARLTLQALSGRVHTVISGVCLVEGGEVRTAVAKTTVEFRELEEWLLEWYLASQEWRGRAGGYAIQGRGGALVRQIEGDYLNVVGLPVSLLLDLAPWLVRP